MTDREKLIELLNEVHRTHLGKEYRERLGTIADYLIANGVTVLPITGIGDMSDGYHTFNELYHHRAMLFSVICNTMSEKAWKAKKHDDGTMYDGMFIVGIETPEGQATYHYDIEPYWEMFDVKELEYAPMWDGHTPDIAIRRIAMLGFNGVTFANNNNVGDKTNADRIRAMTDEELAKILYNHQVCYIRAKRRESCSEYGCEDCLLEWLQQPAEVDNG